MMTSSHHHHAAASHDYSAGGGDESCDNDDDDDHLTLPPSKSRQTSFPPTCPVLVYDPAADPPVFSGKVHSVYIDIGIGSDRGNRFRIRPDFGPAGRDGRTMMAAVSEEKLRYAPRCTVAIAGDEETQQTQQQQEGTIVASYDGPTGVSYSVEIRSIAVDAHDGKKKSETIIRHGVDGKDVRFRHCHRPANETVEPPQPTPTPAPATITTSKPKVDLVVDCTGGSSDQQTKKQQQMRQQQVDSPANATDVTEASTADDSVGSVPTTVVLTGVVVGPTAERSCSPSPLPSTPFPPPPASSGVSTAAAAAALPAAAQPASLGSTCRINPPNGGSDGRSNTRAGGRKRTNSAEGDAEQQGQQQPKTEDSSTLESSGGSLRSGSATASGRKRARRVFGGTDDNKVKQAEKGGGEEGLTARRIGLPDDLDPETVRAVLLGPERAVNRKMEQSLDVTISFVGPMFDDDERPKQPHPDGTIVVDDGINGDPGGAGTGTGKADGGCYVLVRGSPQKVAAAVRVIIHLLVESCGWDKDGRDALKRELSDVAAARGVECTISASGEDASGVAPAAAGASETCFAMESIESIPTPKEEEEQDDDSGGRSSSVQSQVQSDPVAGVTGRRDGHCDSRQGIEATETAEPHQHPALPGESSSSAPLSKNLGQESTSRVPSPCRNDDVTSGPSCAKGEEAVGPPRHSGGRGSSNDRECSHYGPPAGGGGQVGKRPVAGGRSHRGEEPSGPPRDFFVDPDCSYYGPPAEAGQIDERPGAGHSDHLSGPPVRKLEDAAAAAAVMQWPLAAERVRDEVQFPRWIDAGLAAAILIGKQGRTINSMIKESGCNIQTMGKGTRRPGYKKHLTVRIAGPDRNHVERARLLVEKTVLNLDEMKGNNVRLLFDLEAYRRYGTEYEYSNRPRDGRLIVFQRWGNEGGMMYMTVIDLPERIADTPRLLLGQGGRVQKDIESRTGCQIDLHGFGRLKGKCQPYVHILGCGVWNVEECVRLIHGRLYNAM